MSSNTLTTDDTVESGAVYVSINEDLREFLEKQYDQINDQSPFFSSNILFTLDKGRYRLRLISVLSCNYTYGPLAAFQRRSSQTAERHRAKKQLRQYGNKPNPFFTISTAA